jgi:hypothetical protein
VDLSSKTQGLLTAELARLSTLASDGPAGVVSSTDTIRGYQGALSVLRASGLVGELDASGLTRAYELLGAARITSAALVGDNAFHRALSKVQDMVSAEITEAEA